MEYYPLGHTGLKVSGLCLGTMQFGWTADEDTSYQIMSAAFDAGVNFFDTADIYSRWVEGNPGGVAEMFIGNWITKNGIPRDQIVIATKVRGVMGAGPNDQGLSRTHIMQAVEDSLRRLQTDYIDLYQSHWYDEETLIDETLRAFDDLVRQGKVRYIGCSNYPAWRLMRALWTSERLGVARYVSLQPHYSLVHRAEYERELAAVCQEYGLGVIPYSPLAGGFLTGKYRRDETPSGTERARSAQRYMTEQNWAVLDKLTELAQARGKSVSQMALGWLLSQPTVTAPIIGPRTLDQLDDNLGAAGLRLEGDELEALDQLSRWE